MFKYTTIQNFLSKEECDEILNFSLNNLELKVALVGGNDTPDLKSRKSNVAFFDYKEKFPTLTDRILNVIQSDYKFNGYTLEFNNRFQFTQYKAEDFYDWHTDHTTNKFGKNRVCSMVIQLNEDYSGGELQLKDRNNKIIDLEKGIGNLYIFLSDIEHRVNVVETGVRYSLVNWLNAIPIIEYKKTLL
jgi:predicted 2-oxoglutarate/Fe(II)-dependent dioxygenase YbiX